MKAETTQINTQTSDMRQRPTAHQPVGAGTDLVLGDLHGDFLKLVHILTTYDILDPTELEYSTLVTLHDNLSIHPNSYATGVGQALIDVATDIITKIKVKPHSVSTLRLIGDVISDRGPNDYPTLLVLQRLADQGVPWEVSLSNHDFDGLCHPNDRLGTRNHIGSYNEYRSANHMDRMVQVGSIPAEQANNLKTMYMQHIKIIGGSYNETNRTLTNFVHAPVSRTTKNKFLQTLVDMDLIPGVNKIELFLMTNGIEATPQRVLFEQIHLANDLFAPHLTHLVAIEDIKLGHDLVSRGLDFEDRWRELKKISTDRHQSRFTDRCNEEKPAWTLLFANAPTNPAPMIQKLRALAAECKITLSQSYISEITDAFKTVASFDDDTDDNEAWYSYTISEGITNRFKNMQIHSSDFVQPAQKFGKNLAYELMWNRDPINDSYTANERIVFGHTGETTKNISSDYATNLDNENMMGKIKQQSRYSPAETQYNSTFTCMSLPAGIKPQLALNEAGQLTLRSPPAQQPLAPQGETPPAASPPPPSESPDLLLQRPVAVSAGRLSSNAALAALATGVQVAHKPANSLAKVKPSIANAFTPAKKP